MSSQTKPIKRNPALVEFSRDHHYGLLLVWKIRQGQRAAINPARIGDYVSFFYQEDLRHHFADEEAYLFPLLSGHDAQRRRAEREHAEIRSLAGSIREEPFNTDWLSQFAQLLEADIRFEERELFNQLQLTIGNDRLLELLKEIPERPHIEEGAWKDEFWGLKNTVKKKTSHAG